jgi:hypothetical protein
MPAIRFLPGDDVNWTFAPPPTPNSRPHQPRSLPHPPPLPPTPTYRNTLSQCCAVNVELCTEDRKNQNGPRIKRISFLTGLKIMAWTMSALLIRSPMLISGELRINISALTIESGEGVFEAQ